MKYQERIGYKLDCKVRAVLEHIVYYPFHLHEEDLEIICMIDGTAEVSDSAAVHTLSCGDVYIFNPNDPHKIQCEDAAGIMLTIQIDRRYYKERIPGLEEAYFICDTFLQEGEYSMEIKYLRFLLAKIYDLYQNYSDNPDKVRELEEYAVQTLCLLMEDFQQYAYQKDSEGGIRIVKLKYLEHLYKDYDRMYRIVDYICVHFRKKITLQQIAAEEYLSPEHLSRYIKNTLGLTYSELLSLTRCEEAERQLSATKKTVEQIAQEVGFSNRKHLAVQFRRWFGKNPAQYRKEIHKDLEGGRKIQTSPFNRLHAIHILEQYLDGR